MSKNLINKNIENQKIELEVLRNKLRQYFIKVSIQSLYDLPNTEFTKPLLELANQSIVRTK